MSALAVPYHLDEPIAGFVAPTAAAREIAFELPAGPRWRRVAAVQERLADALATLPAPATVFSGDCASSLGVLAGRRRAGEDPAVVWFDAHGDFNTAATSPSGYLGGMPLAEISGRGERPLARALGLTPLADARILLVGARDLDPGEERLLAGSALRRASVEEVAAGGVELPAGPLYLHLDLDVADRGDAPGLLYPAPGGPPLATLEAAVGAVARDGEVVATCLALTFDPDAAGAERSLALARRLLAA